MPRTTPILIHFAALGIAAASVSAGPLTPPPGPVAPTHKTLSEVEPRVVINVTNTPGDSDSVFRITQPGSYYLSGNMTVPADKYGIEVAADDVTLDLGGFRIQGSAGSGVGVASFGARLVVRNGSITGLGDRGIVTDLDARISHVQVSACGAAGIFVGSGSVISDCTVSSCQTSGIYLSGSSGNAERCVIRLCQHGVVAPAGSLVRDCVVSSCTSSGLVVSGVVENCGSTGNSGDGFEASNGASLIGCRASNNTGAGFSLASGSRAQSCVGNDNNTYGFKVGSSCALTSSSAVANAVGAVRINGSYAEVAECSLTGVASFPVITVDQVAGARIAGNRLSAGTLAVAGASASGALVVGNHCVGQSSGTFTLGATCQTGPIVNANGSIASTSPFANFVH